MTPEDQRRFHEFADRQLRNAVIEECAQAFRHHYWDSLEKDKVMILLHIEAVARALKDKP